MPGTKTSFTRKSLKELSKGQTEFRKNTFPNLDTKKYVVEIRMVLVFWIPLKSYMGGRGT